MPKVLLNLQSPFTKLFAMTFKVALKKIKAIRAKFLSAMCAHTFAQLNLK